MAAPGFRIRQFVLFSLQSTKLLSNWITGAVSGVHYLFPILPNILLSFSIWTCFLFPSCSTANTLLCLCPLSIWPCCVTRWSKKYQLFRPYFGGFLLSWSSMVIGSPVSLSKLRSRGLVGKWMSVSVSGAENEQSHPSSSPGRETACRNSSVLSLIPLPYPPAPCRTGTRRRDR